MVLCLVGPCTYRLCAWSWGAGVVCYEYTVHVPCIICSVCVCYMLFVCSVCVSIVRSVCTASMACGAGKRELLVATSSSHQPWGWGGSRRRAPRLLSWPLRRGKWSGRASLRRRHLSEASNDEEALRQRSEGGAFQAREDQSTWDRNEYGVCLEQSPGVCGWSKVGEWREMKSKR